MRKLGLLLTGLFVVVDLCSGQTLVTKPEQTQPATIRPALVGSGPNSLANKIDVPSLVKNGQKSAAIMFLCIVSETGEVTWSATYRGTPDSKGLEQEVLKKLPLSKFIPALVKGKPATVFFYGTVDFWVDKEKGKPRLRIFSNQEKSEMEKGSDFIAPQPIVRGASNFTGFNYPPNTGMAVPVTGTVEVQLLVDAAGNLNGMEVVTEYPPSVGFGQAAVEDFQLAKFVPAHRDGKPEESKVTLVAYYRPPG